MSFLLSFSLSSTRETISGPNGSSAEIELTDEQRLHIVKVNGKSEEEGLALIRQIVERALPQNLILSASVEKVPSHIFYLRMGFTPFDVPLSYLADRYGLDAYEAVTALNTGSPTPEQCKVLKEIWVGEGRVGEVSEEEILAEKEFLIGLIEKPHSYLKMKFVPAFLSLLQQDLKTILSQGTKTLGAMTMQLSPMGRERWAQATKTAFRPFDHLEHLQHSMTPDQQNLLEEILQRKSV